MLFTVAVLEKQPHIPLMIGTAVAIIVTMLHGYAFEEVEEMMYKGMCGCFSSTATVNNMQAIIIANVNTAAVIPISFFVVTLSCSVRIIYLTKGGAVNV